MEFEMGHVSYPMSPMRADKPVRTTFICQRCGKVDQLIVKPQHVIDDPWSTLCRHCVWVLAARNQTEFFTEEFFTEEYVSLERSGWR